jgi:hypothetical protein
LVAIITAMLRLPGPETMPGISRGIDREDSYCTLHRFYDGRTSQPSIIGLLEKQSRIIIVAVSLDLSFLQFTDRGAPN